MSDIHLVSRIFTVMTPAGCPTPQERINMGTENLVGRLRPLFLYLFYFFSTSGFYLSSCAGRLLLLFCPFALRSLQLPIPYLTRQKGSLAFVRPNSTL